MTFSINFGPGRCFLQKAILFLTILHEKRLLGGIAGQHAKSFLANSLDGPRRHVRPASTSLMSSLAVLKREGGPPMQTLTAWESQFYCLAGAGVPCFCKSLIVAITFHTALMFLWSLSAITFGVTPLQNQTIIFIFSTISNCMPLAF